MKYLFDKEHFFATLLVFGVIGGLVLIPVNISFISPFAQAFSDFDITDLVFSRLRSERATASDTSIVIVNIAHLPRNQVARQIKRILAANPVAIGIDAFFRQPKSPEIDSPLVQALALVQQASPQRNRLIMVTKVTGVNPEKDVFDSIETSHPKFSQYADNGFANIIMDSTAGFRTVRSFSPRELVKDNEQFAFSVRLAQLLDSAATSRFLQRKNPTEIINYRGNYSRFYTLDAADVLDSTVDLRFLQGKIVLLGFMGYTLSDQSLEDTFFTPMNPRNAGKSLPDMYGIVIHANIISMILHEAFIDEMSTPMSIVIAFVICYLNMALFHYLLEHYELLYQPLSIVVQLTEWILMVLLLVAALDKWSYKVDFTLTLTACALSAGIFEIYSLSLKPILKTFRHRILFTQSKTIS